MDGDEFIEFDSLINIRPSVVNMSRGVEDEEIRKKIIAIVNKRIIKWIATNRCTSRCHPMHKPVPSQKGTP